jgi:hypothetical protein
VVLSQVVFSGHYLIFMLMLLLQSFWYGWWFCYCWYGSRANNYRLDKQDIKEMYKGLDASVNDADVAKHIMMNTELLCLLNMTYAIHQLKQQR